MNIHNGLLYEETATTRYGDLNYFFDSSSSKWIEMTGYTIIKIYDNCKLVYENDK